MDVVYLISILFQIVSNLGLLKCDFCCVFVCLCFNICNSSFASCSYAYQSNFGVILHRVLNVNIRKLMP